MHLTLRRHRRPAALVALIGVGSGLLYAAVYAAQRGLKGGPGRPPVAVPRFQLVLYVVATVGLFVLYLLLLMMCRRNGLAARRTRLLAFGFPVIFNVLFMLSAPNLSIDLFSYISHGYISTVLHDNPYVQPSSVVARTELGPRLEAYGWRPVHPVSPYGPVWTHVETAVAHVSGGVRAQMVTFKAIVVAASLGSAMLIWFILGRLKPEHQVLGTLAYLWNPMIVVELAGEGHNDSVMVFFVLLALALTMQARVRAGLSAMSLGVLTKYLPVALLPPQLAYLWRARRSTPRFTTRVVSGLAISLGLAIVSFASLWVGVRTLNGIRMSGQLGETGSTPTVILHLVSRIVQPSAADPVAYALAIAALAIVVWLRTSSVSDVPGMLRAGAAISLAYLLFASPSYWPWYAVMPVALMALWPEGLSLAVLVAVSVGSRLAGPLDVMFVNGWVGRREFLLITWVAGIGVPLLVLIRWLAGRVTATNHPPG
jgi:alpha-1,6-mannosyltransferase